TADTPHLLWKCAPRMSALCSEKQQKQLVAIISIIVSITVAKAAAFVLQKSQQSTASVSSPVNVDAQKTPVFYSIFLGFDACADQSITIAGKTNFSRPGHKDEHRHSSDFKKSQRNICSSGCETGNSETRGMVHYLLH